MSSGIGYRCGSDLAWRRLAAVAPIRPLHWELLYAAGAALKKTKKKKRKVQSNLKLDGTVQPDMFQINVALCDLAVQLQNVPSRYCTTGKLGSYIISVQIRTFK